MGGLIPEAKTNAGWEVFINHNLLTVKTISVNLPSLIIK